MQIIQSIRDKGAAIVIVVIALSLIGFILMDAKQGSSKLFGSLSSKIGKVNGDGIELGEFNKRVKQAEDMQAQRGQRPQTYQMRDQMWNQIVAEKIFFAEAEKLGIEFTSKELASILLSDDPSNPFVQEQGMKDSITGKLDIAKAQTAITNIKKFKGEQKEAVNAQIIDPLNISTTVAKYTGLLNASVYYPTWMQEKETAEAKNFASISYVAIPYSEISDSSVVVSDADVNEYVKNHKDMFKQEEGRNISYVSFSQLASAADTAAVASQLEQLKAGFTADSNAKAFVARNSSLVDFTDDFSPKSKLAPALSDTIASLPIGGVFGPFLDKGNYVIAKVLGTNSVPDSVKAKHILIGTNDPQTGQPLMDDSTAKKIADSLLVAVNSGSDFGALAFQYNTDATKTKGGDLGTFGYGAMVKEFNDYCFTHPVGSRAVVKTQFGYHVVEVLNQKDFKPGYKVAYIAKEINPSDVTINNASLEATKASAEKDATALAKYAAKNGLKTTQVPSLVKENDYSVGALQDARQLVQWVFKAKKGDVSEPFSIGDQFVVAMVDKINSKGVQDAASARSGCEAIIRNKKKAEMIIKKIGSNPTLESAATAYGKQIMQAGADSSITMAAQIINGVGVEPKLIGASFNKEYQSKVSVPIDGTSAVYLVKVNGIQAKPADSPEMISQQRTSRISTLRGQVNNWFEGLKKQADITDERSKFF